MVLAGAAARRTRRWRDEEPTGTTAVQVDDAVLRWGVNNESSNRAFAPRTYNFFSAGLVPDPGEGGDDDPAGRSGSRPAGDVQIQKWNGSAWRKATWAGLSTDSDGKPLGSPTAGTFSNHRFVFSGGTGEVDAEAGTAHVEWDGDLTVLYYSGMSMFYVSDPVLDVADGRGTLTATVQGYASSVDDPDTWEPVEPATVTLADLPDVDLADERGFTVDAGLPRRRASTASARSPATGGPARSRRPSSTTWTGSAPRRSGCPAAPSTDPFKVALPLSVGFDARRRAARADADRGSRPRSRSTTRSCRRR